MTTFIDYETVFPCFCTGPEKESAITNCSFRNIAEVNPNHGGNPDLLQTLYSCDNPLIKTAERGVCPIREIDNLINQS